ncbi:MAG: sugar phosphate isomerase/epimerase [Chloroflexi bacterium]|nr:sugar phosphate isomerase/epimerase [Chloroflexota bacterium]
MKLSFMTFACPEWDVPSILDAARRYGSDGVEIRVSANHRHGVEVDLPSAARAAVRRQFADAGVAVSCVATSLTLVSLDRAAAADALRRHLDLAADLGAPVIRVFCGRLPEGTTLDVAVERVADSLRAGADQAAAAGVCIGLETHDSFSLGRTVGRTLSQVPYPSVGAVWDVQHPFLGGESLAETAGFLRGRVVHTHFHDFVRTERTGRLAGEGRAWRIVPLGQGLLPIDETLGELRSLGYTGYLSGEWWPEMVGEADVAIPAYVAALRMVECASGRGTGDAGWTSTPL